MNKRQIIRIRVGNKFIFWSKRKHIPGWFVAGANQTRGVSLSEAKRLAENQ